MKLYSAEANASISMHDSPNLRALLRDAIRRCDVQAVVETGTFWGTGSTRFLAESFPEREPPELFITIETSWQNWRKARTNLRRFSFVRPVWGLTLDREQALAFVKADECLRDHKRYPDVFIDNIDNPARFYERELRGRLIPLSLRDLFLLPWYLHDRVTEYAGEDLLRRSLAEAGARTPLVLLDSAGGTGFLEFKTMLEALAGRQYLVLLDDIHHLKHFRSLRHIQGDLAFEVLGLDMDDGWVLAEHHAGARP
jgi:hypothetical protein